ncbi:MAG TPA: DUF5916 domain-containing protein [Thermoanaerobaculia bacterium]|jgi:hypothetical protein
MKRAIICLAVLLANVPAARATNWPERPVLHAVRATSPIVIDGDLSDAAWQAAPAFTDFTQHDPDDGKPSTLPTSVKILYDDKAVYFGAKMVDDHPPTALLSRRDVLVNGDFLSINIDSQHDRLSGNAFTVTPAGEQGDTVLYNDIGEDPSWDGVWESAVKTVPDGWIAEVRIPFSQLRFPDRDKQVWGINITRRIFRLQETVRIVNTPKGGVGFVSHFADLAGIEEIHRGKPLELVPYAVGRSDVQSRFDRTDPFLQSSKEKIDGGLDLKYALTSTLTLTGTVNPDFGQVEVDPAVVNLTQFETFYPEKRPFFTEGFQIFSFGDSPAPEHWNFTSIPTFFYSRRIGRAPQGTVNADFVDEPTTTTILGAAKVTGKVGKWTVGVLDALTDNETARFATGPLEQRQTVEPMSNYFVTRDTRDFGSNSRIGIMVTSVDRRLPEELSYLRSRADMVGIDGYSGTANNNWIFEWFAAGSRLAGSAESIADAQNAPERYYGRPDAKSFHLDPTRTSLQGWAGKAMLSKATGLWRGLVQVQAYSPGFETNDVGFMTRTDTISTNAVIHYDNDHPTERFREKHVWFGAWSNQNFDHDALGRGVFAEHSAVLANYWNYDTNLFLSPDVLDDRLTRGGPLVRARRSWDTIASLGSDNRKHFYFALSAHANGAADGLLNRTLGVTLTAQPSPSLLVSVSPTIGRLHDHTQYVTTVADPAATATYGNRYVFADLDQRTFELGTRVDWTLTPKMSFQLYMQPFVASGDFHDYHSLAAPRTADYEAYTGAVASPDFDFRSVRASAVARWEFRPGSALYVVWNENRADTLDVGTLRLARDLRGVANAPSHDVFLIKMSYWLPF